MAKERYSSQYEVGPGFLTKLFSSLQFSRNVREILVKTGNNLVVSLRNQGTFQVPELGFLVDRQMGGGNFFIHDIQQGIDLHSMAGARLEFSFSRYLRYRMMVGSNAKLLAQVHFHHPCEIPLIPSPVGDLYSLFLFRQSASLDPLSYFSRRVIGVLGRVEHPDYSEEPLNFLFYQETKGIESMSEDQLKNKLQDLQDFFLRERELPSFSQKAVLDFVRGAGYKAEHISIPRERFYKSNLFSQEGLEKIASFAH